VVFLRSDSPFWRSSRRKERPHVAHLLPVPVSRVPLEVVNETGTEDPIESGFLTWGGDVLGQSEGCTMAVLGEYP